MPHPTAPAYEDDALLVAAVLRGDMEAFKKLITLYEKLVISIVFKMVHRVEDSEDLCQDIFLKVYEKLNSFHFQSKLSTWIGSIAFNTCVNFLQKKRLLLSGDFLSTAYGEEELQIPVIVKDTANDPGDKLEYKEREALLLQNVQQLSVIQQTVLQLFHYNELSLQEISAITGLPVSTVKSHLFRARKVLKDAMNTY